MSDTNTQTPLADEVSFKIFGAPAISSEASEAALDIRRQFASASAAVEADQLLSDEGKAIEIAKYRDRANAHLADIAQSDAKAAAAERAALEAKLLRRDSVIGSTADKIAATASYRDAISRAGMATTPAALLALQRSAILTGDVVLSKATLVVGLERGDVDVVNGWSAANPTLEADVDRLFLLTHPRGNNRNALRNALEQALTFGGVR